MNKKCICQICTCRRHKCSHNPFPQNRGGPCSFSEYTNQYTQHPIELRTSCKPEYTLKNSQDPLDDKTTHRMDFITHQVEKLQKRQPEKWQKPEGCLDDLTNYRNDFTENVYSPQKRGRCLSCSPSLDTLIVKPCQPSRMIRPTETRNISGKFQGEPTYQSDYIGYGVQPRTQPVAPSSSHKPSEHPFDGISNYSLDFIKYGAPITKSMKPLEAPICSGIPFQDMTDYKESYKNYPIEAKPMKEKIQWLPNTTPLDDMSSYKKDYTPKDLMKLESCRPDQTPFRSKDAFDGTTNHKLDYIHWPVGNRTSIKPQEALQKLDGQMNFDTTTQLDYQAYEREFFKKPSARPFELDSLQNITGRFDGTTNYVTDYKPWSLADRQPMDWRKKGEYVASDACFDAEPSYKVDYTPKPLVLTKSAKPLDLGYKSNAPFQDATEYKKEFLVKKSETCPVTAIKSGSDQRYQLLEVDDIGHSWYAYRSTMATA